MELQSIQSPGVLTTRTVFGTIKRPTAKSSKTSDNWFKGEHVEGQEYLAGEGVGVSTGTNAGTYLALEDTDDTPGNSNSWYQLSNNAIIGRWS
jgi:hypothetical protein